MYILASICFAHTSSYQCDNREDAFTVGTIHLFFPIYVCTPPYSPSFSYFLPQLSLQVAHPNGARVAKTLSKSTLCGHTTWEQISFDMVPWNTWNAYREPTETQMAALFVSHEPVQFMHCFMVKPKSCPLLVIKSWIWTKSNIPLIMTEGPDTADRIS